MSSVVNYRGRGLTRRCRVLWTVPRNSRICDDGSIFPACPPLSHPPLLFPTFSSPPVVPRERSRIGRATHASLHASSVIRLCLLACGYGASRIPHPLPRSRLVSLSSSDDLTTPRARSACFLPVCPAASQSPLENLFSSEFQVRRARIETRTQKSSVIRFHSNSRLLQEGERTQFR